MFIAILQHTPTWVFVLLLALIGLGVSQSFPRALSLRRSTMLPLLMVGLSLIGVVSAFGGQALALPAWAVGLAAALAALHRRVDVSRVRYSAATQRFALPGSWWPLGLMLGLFALKFAVGVTLATSPEQAQSLPLALAASAAYGVFSGVFLGRAAALWRCAREAEALSPARSAARAPRAGARARRRCAADRA